MIQNDTKQVQDIIIIWKSLPAVSFFYLVFFFLLLPIWFINFFLFVYIFLFSFLMIYLFKKDIILILYFLCQFLVIIIIWMILFYEVCFLHYFLLSLMKTRPNVSAILKCCIKVTAKIIEAPQVLLHLIRSV